VAAKFDAELVALADTLATLDDPPHGVHVWKRDTHTTVAFNAAGRLTFYSEPAAS
jgi:hypothetical protein